MFDCKVKIVDAVMGAGKTSAAINFINNSDSDIHFLYITPYLTEVERIVEQCSEKHFREPKNINGRKLEGIKSLIKHNVNIVSTHALFHNFDRELIDLCRVHNYTLIMDEVADVIERYNISVEDYNLLKANFVTIDPDTKFLEWREKAIDYEGKFSNEKRLCDLHCLVEYGESVMMWLFPVEVFNSFREIYILTYMFKSQIQCYYYDFYSLPYDFLYVKGDSVENYRFTENQEEQLIVSKDYKNLIHILNNERMNQLGDRHFDLSKQWYQRNKDGAINQVKKNLYNYFANIRKAKSGDIIWTTFKDYKNNITGKGYSRGFIPLNTRASNKYRDRTSIAYPVNRFINTGVKNFFTNRNVNVEEDGYALSEMLQFIWRSAIRDDKEIWVYIPSIRMRTLLQNWIDENSVTNVTSVASEASPILSYLLNRITLLTEQEIDLQYKLDTSVAYKKHSILRNKLMTVSSVKRELTDLMEEVYNL